MSCRNLSSPLDLQTPKPQGSKQTTFSQPRSPLRSAQAGSPWWQVAIEIPFSSPHYVQLSFTRRAAANSRASGPKRSGNDMALIQSKCPTLSLSEVILLTNCLARPASDRNAPRNGCGGTERLMPSLAPVCSQLRGRRSASIDAKAPLPSLNDQEPKRGSAAKLAHN